MSHSSGPGREGGRAAKRATVQAQLFIIARTLGKGLLWAAFGCLMAMLSAWWVRVKAEGHERNIQAVLQRRATEESADFVVAHLANVRSFPNRFDLLQHALSLVTIQDGLYCEFGVFQGNSIRFVADQIRPKGLTIHGFDSFEGNPESWNSTPPGHFRVSSLPRVPRNVVLHKGWFEQTVPAFRRSAKGPLAFVHLDADLYSSTRTVLLGLAEWIVPGTVIVFDEYFNYPGWREHEYRAFREFVESRGTRFEYVGYCPSGEQVAVKIQ